MHIHEFVCWTSWCSLDLRFVLWCFFFFKQKTAYEMRISDWSSDVCSSDLSMTVNGRLELSDNDSLQGFQAAAFDLPAGNPFSPFATPTSFYRYLRQAGELGQQIKGTTGHVGVTLSGLLGGGWQWS